MEFRTRRGYYTGLVVATDFIRVVHGGRGDYLEFAPEHIVHENIHIPENQKWRLEDAWSKHVFYTEYRTNDSANVMIYFQKRYVGYADYKPGLYYIAPKDLVWVGCSEETVARILKS